MAARAWTVAANAAGSPAARTTRIRRARESLDAALRLRPLSAHAWVVAAFVDGSVGARGEALGDLARSYTLAPFLREDGLWRMGVGASSWADLAPPVRERLLDEADWLAALGPDSRRQVQTQLGGSPAAVAFALRRLRPAPSLRGPV
jgi:hypothetical protein